MIKQFFSQFSSCRDLQPWPGAGQDAARRSTRPAAAGEILGTLHYLRGICGTNEGPNGATKCRR